MIDDLALKALAKVDPEVACVIVKGTAYVHSRKFVLELPEKQIKAKKWPAGPPGGPMDYITLDPKTTVHPIAEWRTLLPKNQSYLKTTSMRDTAPNGTESIQLMSLTTDDSRWMQLAYYEFFQEQLDSPSFRIMTLPPIPDEPSGIGIFQDDRLVGVLSYYTG